MSGIALGHKWRWLVFVFISFLLIMILMRLIWLQRRQYHPDLEMRTMVGAEVLLRENNTICNNIRDIVFLWPRVSRQETYTSDRNLFAWYSSRGARYLISRFHCGYGAGGEQHFIENNQKLVMAIVFFCALASRFMTGSWMISLVVATVLLSRGRTVGEVGSLSVLLWIKGLLALWYCLLVHYIRTTSVVSLVGGTIVLALLAFVERSFVALALLFPLCFFILFLIKWFLSTSIGTKIRLERVPQPVTKVERQGAGRSSPLRQSKGERQADWMEFRFLAGFVRWVGLFAGPQTATQEQGGILSPIHSPFFVWVYRRHKIWTLMKIHLAIAVVFAMAILWATIGDSIGLAALWQHGGSFSSVNVSDQWPIYWFVNWVRPLDLDLSISFVMILIVLWVPWPRQLDHFREICVLTLLSIGLISLSALAWDLLDVMFVANNLKSFWVVTANLIPRAAQVFLWWDPIIITVGVSGLIHIYINVFLKSQTGRIFLRFITRGDHGE